MKTPTKGLSTVKEIMSSIFWLIIFLSIMFLVIGILSYLLSVVFFTLIIGVPIAFVLLNIKAISKH